MAGSDEDRIMDLIRPFISDNEDLLRVAKKLDSHHITVDALLSLSERDLEGLIKKVFPAASVAEEFGLKAAIRSRQKNPMHGHSKSIAIVDRQPAGRPYQEGVSSRIGGSGIRIQAAIQSRIKNPTHEGAPLSKKVKLSVEALASAAQATAIYFEKLLEPPADLPRNATELGEFLGQIPVQLPVDPWVYRTIFDSKLLTLEVSEGAQSFARILATLLNEWETFDTPNEATSSAYLYSVTGKFIRNLNHVAPLSRQLQNLLIVLDSANPQSTQTLSKPLEPLSRPDFQLFVKGCLVLRWENKVSYDALGDALDENTAKMKEWSPLFYGALPFVIGGCCAGKQFHWLRLVPDGKKVRSESILPSYDLSSLKGVAAFLLSNIRMHGLLQKLQETLKDQIKLTLYRPTARGEGGSIMFYPHYVRKEIQDVDGASHTMRESLYQSITGSKYLIQGKLKKLRKKTVLLLEPVGDPYSEPVTVKELEDATHDILCGVMDLHKEGYTHKDIRWENCIKVNVKGEMKWILIDLEAAGVDGEEWNHSKLLKVWDDNTLENNGGKQKYTKASDIYLLGKLICEWLDGQSGMDEKGYEVMKSRGEKMKRERLPAVEVKEEFCTPNCARCVMFG